MRIGILGSGDVGMSLARGFAREGHDVMVGTRDADQPAVVDWLSSTEGARAGDYAEAVAFGDIVIPAVPGRVVAETVAAIGADAFEDKLVIDPTNPVRYGENGPEAVYPEDDSAAEHLQRLLPGARVVKAFNQIPAGSMTSPDPSVGRPMMRICGDDDDAKATVTDLLESFGWEVRDLGPLSESRRLERSLLNWLRKRAAGS